MQRIKWQADTGAYQDKSCMDGSSSYNCKSNGKFWAECCWSCIKKFELKRYRFGSIFPKLRGLQKVSFDNGVIKMHEYFRYHSKLDSFRLFSVGHLMTIGVIFFLCILLIVLRNELKKNGKRRLLRLSLASLLVVSEASQHLWLMGEKAWSIKRDLPLQLSDLSVLLAIVMLFVRSNKLFLFLYFAGLGSSIQAILTPDLRFSFPHFQTIEFFVSHGGVVLACLFMAMAFPYRPTIKSMWMTILIVNLYAAGVFFLNKVLGANYLYIMKKPRNASLLDYLGPWPWYLLSMELVMILSFYLLFSPFWIKKLR